MNGAKLQLSEEELALVSDPGWILTKNSIMERTVALMSGLSGRIEQELGDLRQMMEFGSAGYVPPPNWDTPKISRGENYQGLPYVILDHPRLFTRDHILAIRTMFWWGHYFMVTLHLKGWPMDMYRRVLNRHMGELTAAGFHMASSGDEWRHELDGGAYAPLKEEGIDTVEEYPFLKLSAKCPLDKWNEAPEILRGLNELLIRALTTSR